MLKNRKNLFILLMIAICTIAFLLRLEVCRELEKYDSQVTAPSIYTDMYTYKHYSELILKGEYHKEFYYQPFYYSMFLPSVKYFFGMGIWPVIFFQTLLSVLTIWLAALTSSMIWGKRAGIITALLLLFSSIMILYVPYYLIATLQAFWVALTAYLSIKYIKFELKTGAETAAPSIVNWSILGFILSLAILTRGNIWFFVPGIIFAAAFARLHYSKTPGKNRIRKLIPVMCMIVMIILPQLPFAIINTRIKGRITGPSTAAAAVLSLGNTPESPPGGRDPGSGPGAMEYPATCRYWSSTSEKVSVFSRMQDWFNREPLAFPELQWRKMMLFWDRREIPNNIAIEYQGLKSPTLLYAGLIPSLSMKTPSGVMKFIPMNLIPSTVLMLVLAFAGFIYMAVRIFKHSGKSFISSVKSNILNHLCKYLILYFLTAYWLGTAAFYMLARFRVPAIPLMAVCGGGFLHLLITRIPQRKKAAGLLAALLLSIFIVNFGYDFYRYNLEAGIMRIVRPDGVVSRLKNETLVMDNGPASFGSWRLTELKKGVVLTKLFPESVSEIKNVTAKLRINLVWQRPGRAILKINGRNIILKENAPIKKMYEFPIPADQINRITIIPQELDCRIFAIIDNQRNYNRTTADNKNTGGELVCSLILQRDNN